MDNTTIIPAMFFASLDAGGLFRWGLFVFVAMVALIVAIACVYDFLCAPYRRQERARFFVDLLERQLKAGRTVEQVVRALAETQDRMLGWRFYLLAAQMETGLRLGQALERVPGFLPSRVCAIIKAGEEFGDVRRVLPVCRQTLTAAQSEVRSDENHLMVVAFSVGPFPVAIFSILSVYILPKFRMIMNDLEAVIPPFSAFVFDYWGWFMAASGLLALVGWLAAWLHSGEAGGLRFIQRGLYPAGDWLELHLPWKRKRLLRDFTAMLALLLDAGLPEERALRLAGDSTANWFIRERVEESIARLKSGVKLTDAVAELDRSGEFRWRMENARHSAAGFAAALASWLETLSAKAFQQEQTSAQTLTSVLVLLNGMIIGVIASALFMTLISLIQAGTLW